jgi:hypothetical protein
VGVDLMDALVESELKEALAARGCPVCWVGEAAARRYLRFTLHESVNDPATRTRLAAAWGFCRRHAWHFLQWEEVTMRDGLGTAIIAEALLRTAKELLEAHTGAPSVEGRRKKGAQAALQKLVRDLTPAGECPACHVQAQHEAYALTVALALLEGEAWRERLAGSDGLCVAHLRTALTSGAAPDHLRWLVEDHRRRLHQLLGDLEEYIRKHDYRFRDEPYGRERDVTQRATATLAGSWFDLPRRAVEQDGIDRERVRAEKEEGDHHG